MSKTVIESTNRQSNSGYHRTGGKNWWLKGPNGFINNIPTIRGDKVFKCELELTPGQYTLGVGPNNRDGIRQQITVV